MPKCSKCHQSKPANQFYNKRSEANGLSRWCGQCHRTYQQAHRAGANERARLFKAQHGRCGICQRPERAIHNITRKVKRLALDIGPNGEIRGLLCARCNTALGMFEDDPIYLRRALEYVLHLGNLAK
jgi:Autographiviridae endonuclease VII